MAAIQQAFVEHLLERPPGRFDVVVVEGHVRVVKVDPVRHPLGHFSPGCFVGPDRFSARLIELGHPVGFNGLVAHQIKSLLDFDLNGQAVRVPTAFPLDQEPLHRLPSANKVLVGASNNVMDAGFSVGRGRPLKEDERGVRAAVVNGGLEGLFRRPLLEQTAFQINGVQFTRRGRLSHVSPTEVPVLNAPPNFVHFHELTASLSILHSRLRRSINASLKNLEGASFKSFNDHREPWRVGVAMHRPLAWWCCSS